MIQVPKQLTAAMALLAAMPIVLDYEVSASADLNPTPKVAEAQMALPPHGSENDYPPTSAKDNIVQMVTDSLSRGSASIIGPNGPEAVPLWW